MTMVVPLVPVVVAAGELVAVEVDGAWAAAVAVVVADVVVIADAVLIEDVVVVVAAVVVVAVVVSVVVAAAVVSVVAAVVVVAFVVIAVVVVVAAEDVGVAERVFGHTAVRQALAEYTAVSEVVVVWLGTAVAGGRAEVTADGAEPEV